ncbi:unnamed protein product [Plasmodium vivax]|uniref:(malaria parasite P. vivax) hypothetical protein n=1 Tax=Plasmodium vivax TaxID=5855 RepID=A0A8S4HCP2_PLAVI|nr:unnamed protein product [Plasmodium vivax]
MSNPAENVFKEIPEIVFYNELFDESPVNNDIQHYLQVCGECKKFSYVQEFVGQLVRNYNNYKALSGNNAKNKYCRFFLYWLYRAKEFQFTKVMSHLRNQWDKCIPCVWNKLEDDADNHNGKCNFENEDISFGVIQVQKALDEICSIKEKFKNDSEVNSNVEKFSKINEIKQYYLKVILSIIGSISSTNSWKKKHFEIDEDCSLSKIYNYLSEIQCPPKEIVQHVQAQQCKAPEQEKLLKCEIDTCLNLDELCQQRSATQSCSNPDKLCEKTCEEKPCDLAECAIKNNFTPQSCDSLKQLYPTLCKTKPPNLAPTIEEQPENPAKNPYLQLPVTVFSSVVGTIFFFLFLYKFTPFRSWFLNRIGSKDTLKHKMKQEMDREFLGAPFHPPYVDDQNSRPRVGYSQN